MSAVRTKHFRAEWRWSFPMIPWYRQLISLVYGIGVILIALWAIQQGSGPYVVLGVVGMSMLTLMLIFGVEVNHVSVSLDGFAVDFSETSDSDGEGDAEPDDGPDLTEWSDG